MKAKVALKEGFRYHRTDNTFVDLKEGDVIEADDIPGMQKAERLMAGHLVPVGAEAAPEPESEKKEAPAKGKK